MTTETLIGQLELQGVTLDMHKCKHDYIRLTWREEWTGLYTPNVLLDKEDVEYLIFLLELSQDK